MDLEWLAAVWVSVERDGAPGLGVGRGGVPPNRSGEVDRKPKARARRSLNLRVGRGGARGLGDGRGGANPQGSDETESAALVSGETEPVPRGRARRIRP